MKNCPWCGSEPIMTTEEICGYPGYYLVKAQCSKCGARAPHGEYDTLAWKMDEAFALAVEVWDKRADNNKKKHYIK